LLFIFLKKKEKQNFCLLRYCSFTAAVLIVLKPGPAGRPGTRPTGAGTGLG
jgi:hypothetical protein